MTELNATSATAVVPEPEQILAGLREAIADVLEQVDLAKIDLESLHADTPLLSLPIDSMALMEIMSRIEDAFRVYIPEEQAYSFTTAGELVDFVRNKALVKAARRQG